MKNHVLSLICLTMFSAGAQEVTGGRTTVFSFTPVSRKVSQVNGFAFGIGNGVRDMWADSSHPVTLNGLNIEINPISPLILMFADPERMDNDTAAITNNGLYIAAGGFLGNTVQNGVALSAYNVTLQNNGISISGLYNVSKHLNGLHISGIANSSSVAGAGVLVAPFNAAGKFTGLQLGISNRAEAIKGVQLGLFNKSNSRGLQLGLWNTNARRSLPVINW